MKVVYEGCGVKLINKNGKYFIRYDAGAHQIEIREDEVDINETKQILEGKCGTINQILVDIQKRLINSGVDPYRSNVENKKHEL